MTPPLAAAADMLAILPLLPLRFEIRYDALTMTNV